MYFRLTKCILLVKSTLKFFLKLGKSSFHTYIWCRTVVEACIVIDMEASFWMFGMSLLYICEAFSTNLLLTSRAWVEV